MEEITKVRNHRDRYLPIETPIPIKDKIFAYYGGIKPQRGLAASSMNARSLKEVDYMKANQIYSASLTSDTFLYYELKQVLKLKAQGLTDNQISDVVVIENIFQYKSRKSAQRIVSSIFRRVNVLDDCLINLVLNESLEVGKIVNLYAIMKTSRIFFEFMDEIVRVKIENKDDFIDKRDINIFFTSKAEQSDIAAKWSATTVGKLKQVILKILSQMGIIEDVKECRISRLLIAPELTEHLVSIGDKAYLLAMGEYVE